MLNKVAVADLSLRLAVPADARSLGVLGTQVFLDTYAPQGIRPLIADEVLEHFSTDAIARLLARPATVFIVAESAGHRIGFAQLTRGARPPQGNAVDAVELARLYVLERFTGRGVGKRLLRESERWALSNDASMLWLTAWIGNRRALAFYAAQGYADAGTSFYDFQGERYENRLFVKGVARADRFHEHAYPLPETTPGRVPMPPTAQPAAEFTRARDFLLAHREDHATAYRDFRWPELDRFNWALDHFDAMAAGNEATALHIVGEDGSETKRSFRQMSERSSQVANFLRGLGVQRGDRVLLMLGNELPLWEVMLACCKLGAVLIPATSLLTTDDLRDRLVRGAVRHVVTASAQAAKFAPLPGDYTRVAIGEPVDGWQRYEDAASAPIAFVPDGDTLATDPLLLYFTSGTTSLPKLVLHTHQSYPVGHLSTMYWIGLRPGDVHLNISSPGWAKHAWSCFFAPWNAGACIFIYNYARFDAPKLLAALATHRVSSLCAPPTVWRMLIQHDLAAYRGRLALREVIGAGEPLNPEIIEQVKAAWGLTLRDGYGQTETTAQIGNSPGQPLKPGSMGRPLPGYRIVLLNADEQPADEGEVCLDLGGDGGQRPLGLMVGYQDDAGKTEQAMRGGLYRTGDVATRDAEGYITFVGRADDVFKASDYRISPFELESALIEHEAVTEVAIVPSPDPLRMAVPKAFLILAVGAVPDAALAQAIFAFARERLAPYKRVRRIEFVAELPKTISGKIRRVQLRAQEAERRAADTRGDAEFFEDDFPVLRG